MSIVGPRPLLIEYLPLYSSEQARRHEVRPGITGWAQVNGRNAIAWKKKFNLDVWYVDNQNLFLDLKIIFMTLQKVFDRSGIDDEEVSVKKSSLATKVIRIISASYLKDLKLFLKNLLFFQCSTCHIPISPTMLPASNGPLI